MEDPKYELEIPVTKSEEDTIIDNQEVNLHSVIDAENRSDSEADSPKFVEEIKESTVSEVQKYSSLDSTTEKILPDDSLHDLCAFMKYLSLEHEDSNTGNFDEQEDINSRNIRVKNFVDVYQTKVCENEKYDSLKEVKEESSCENSKKEFAPTKSEKVQPLKQTFPNIKRRALKTEKRNKVSSKSHHSASIDDAKQELEAVLPDTQIASAEKRVDQTYEKTIHLSAETLVGRRSQICQAHISTNHKGTKKTSHGQFDMVRGDRSKNQAVSDKIITGKAEKTGCLNESRCETEVSPCNSLLNSGNSATIHEPMAASDISFQINNRNIAFDTDEMSIALNLLVSEQVEERMIEEFAVMVMKLPFDGLQIEEKFLDFLGHLCDILDKNIGVNSEKLLKKEIEYFKATKKKLEDVSIELNKFVKQMDETENFAMKPDFKTKATKKKLEDVFNLTKKAIKQRDVMSSEKFAMKPDFKPKAPKKKLEDVFNLTKKAIKQTDVMSSEKFAMKGPDFETKAAKKKLEDVCTEINKFMKQIDVMCSEKFAMKPDLKTRLRDNIEFMYTKNSTLYPHFKKVLEKLREMDNRIVIKGSKENRLKNMIAEFVEVIESMHGQTFNIQETVKFCFEKMASLQEKM